MIHAQVCATVRMVSTGFLLYLLLDQELRKQAAGEKNAAQQLPELREAEASVTVGSLILKWVSSH